MHRPISGWSGHLVLPTCPPKKHKLGRGRWNLASCKVSLNIRAAVFREVENISANQRQGRSSYFSDPPKNTNLVEDDKILLPVEFRWIPLCGFRGEVENISANQRPGRQSCFSDRPEKHKLIRRRWDLASYQVSFNFNQRRSRKCLNLSEAERPSCFSDRPEKQKLGSLWLRCT